MRSPFELLAPQSQPRQRYHKESPNRSDPYPKLGNPYPSPPQPYPPQPYPSPQPYKPSSGMQQRAASDPSFQEPYQYQYTQQYQYQHGLQQSHTPQPRHSQPAGYPGHPAGSKASYPRSSSSTASDERIARLLQSDFESEAALLHLRNSNSGKWPAQRRDVRVLGTAQEQQQPRPVSLQSGPAQPVQVRRGSQAYVSDPAFGGDPVPVKTGTGLQQAQRSSLEAPPRQGQKTDPSQGYTQAQYAASGYREPPRSHQGATGSQHSGISPGAASSQGESDPPPFPYQQQQQCGQPLVHQGAMRRDPQSWKNEAMEREHGPGWGALKMNPLEQARQQVRQMWRHENNTHSKNEPPLGSSMYNKNESLPGNNTYVKNESPHGSAFKDAQPGGGPPGQREQEWAPLQVPGRVDGQVGRMDGQVGRMDGQPEVFRKVPPVSATGDGARGPKVPQLAQGLDSQSRGFPVVNTYPSTAVVAPQEQGTRPVVSPQDQAMRPSSATLMKDREVQTAAREQWVQSAEQRPDVTHIEHWEGKGREEGYAGGGFASAGNVMSSGKEEGLRNPAAPASTVSVGDSSWGTDQRSAKQGPGPLDRRMPADWRVSTSMTQTGERAGAQREGGVPPPSVGATERESTQREGGATERERRAEVEANEAAALAVVMQELGLDSSPSFSKRSASMRHRLATTESVPLVMRVNSTVRASEQEELTEQQRLQRNLQAFALREMPIVGDGNCQFRALADQLFGTEAKHADVRRVVVAQLRKCSARYSPYVPEPFQEYVKSMAKNGTWGDHITLQAASDRYKVKITLITSFKEKFVVEISPTNERPCAEAWLSYYAEKHYNSVYEAGRPLGMRGAKKTHWLMDMFS